ncbi:hypothetical protein BDW59DRAFT_148414 [Aspergillus cavernicola]|uniref:Uncharacterized protein n=1 Tax=Aspergillus cavernicola TaxID=176166 RepID=A0ABR4I873_9EURO
MLDIMKVWEMANTVIRKDEEFMATVTRIQNRGTDRSGKPIYQDLLYHHQIEFRPRLEEMVEKLRRMRDQMSRRNVWHRAWVRPFLQEMGAQERYIREDQLLRRRLDLLTREKY